MPGMVQTIEGLGERLTHVDTVRECPKSPGTCCASRRKGGPAGKGDFAKKCREHDPPLRVVVGGRELEPKPKLEGFSMARRHRRSAALAEYGEPFGDVGFLVDLFDTRDLKDFGIVVASAMGTAVVIPKAIKLIDNLTFLGKATPYVKGGASILAGFATYKYLGRRLPARWHDAIVASAAVMAGLGATTIGHELFDTGSVGAKLKGIHGLGDLFPVSLSNVGPEEETLLASLQAIEDQALAGDMDPQFGAYVNDDEVPQFSPEMEAPTGMFGDAGVEEMNGLDAYENELEGLDASISNPDGWAYGEEQDLNALSLMQ